LQVSGPGKTGRTEPQTQATRHKCGTAKRPASGAHSFSADVVERESARLGRDHYAAHVTWARASVKSSHLLKPVGFAAYLLVTVCVLLLVLEFVVRLVFPHINHQDTERSLFLAPTAGQNVHWRPGAAGISFGEAVQIDEFGYRDLKGGAAAAQQSWLLIGDSVTFGVGVDAKDTFAGLLQAANPAVKVWNTAVVGYGVDDYLDVVKEFLAKPTPPSQVILAFCLNDPVGRFDLGPEAVPVSEKILGLLRRHSKLYMLMKGNLTDRSKTYFANDRALYDAANPAFPRTIQVLRETHALLSRAGIPFLVVVLPYEYQLRRKDEGDLVPQRLLTAKLHELGIPASDLYDAFAASGRPSGELFLYGDPMHLSREGHELVFKSIASRLDTANRTQSLQAPRGNQ
jgi:lysophospholipase L1-like esterase